VFHFISHDSSASTIRTRQTKIIKTACTSHRSIYIYIYIRSISIVCDVRFLRVHVLDEEILTKPNIDLRGANVVFNDNSIVFWSFKYTHVWTFPHRRLHDAVSRSAFVFKRKRRFRCDGGQLYGISLLIGGVETTLSTDLSFLGDLRSNRTVLPSVRHRRCFSLNGHAPPTEGDLSRVPLR